MYKSISEMAHFTKRLKGQEETVYGLAGLGDLYVSSAGGRNSKMGKLLGEGNTYQDAKEKFMKNDTVEGAELIFEIGDKQKEKTKDLLKNNGFYINKICKDIRFNPRVIISTKLY